MYIIRNAIRAYRMHQYIPLLLFNGACILMTALGVKFTVSYKKLNEDISRRNKLVMREKELLIQTVQEFDCKE